ncbi:hypothetical protein DBR43_27035 [Pedobacter sp. KBW06]|uniref:hypothetical protein n=1 Tax=Pedobacter sp. KBW06 TaxID=2153359 RepID=UPI000F597AD2|nr:hypothetical protein [Pedobacter sp. KBW06]RQO65906.1 hypothetical protein DBR43_27035 [Pedobacter sp. KBW06]
MGSYVEINDTLQLTTEQGFPSDLMDREQHIINPVTLADVEGKIFNFKDKPSARIFQLDPVRVYYVHNINGKWLFWGRIFIQSETIYKKLDAQGNWTEGEWLTSGTYTIIDVYDPVYQKVFTLHEAPPDRNYFIPDPSKD